MKCKHCGTQNDDRSKLCAKCGKPLEPAADDKGDPTVTQPFMPVRPTMAERLQGRGKSVGIAVALGCALVLGAIGFGAWRLGAFNGPVKEEAEQADDADTDSEAKTEATTDEASTYTRPTEPWNTDDGGAQQGQQGSAAGSAGSYQRHDGDSYDPEPAPAAPEASEPAPKKEEQPQEEKAPEPAPEDDGVPVRDGMADYSWSELSALAGRIESCTDEQQALEVARRHHLVDESGALTDAVHEVALEDGTTMRMRLVGIWHDRADTPSGRAGLSFMSTNIVGRHTYGDTETVEGGWGACSLRSWMGNDLLGALPDDLERAIRPVYKRTNRSMSEVSPDMVTETLDTLWAPSIIELCGPIAWEYHTEPDKADLYNSVFNEEGTQYRAFAQMAIDDYGPNAVFSAGDEWWLRSCSPRSGRGRFVSVDGDPSYISMANEEKGVVVGFCL